MWHHLFSFDFQTYQLVFSSLEQLPVSVELGRLVRSSGTDTLSSCVGFKASWCVNATVCVCVCEGPTAWPWIWINPSPSLSKKFWRSLWGKLWRVWWTDERRSAGWSQFYSPLDSGVNYSHVLNTCSVFDPDVSVRSSSSQTFVPSEDRGHRPSHLRRSHPRRAHLHLQIRRWEHW